MDSNEKLSSKILLKFLKQMLWNGQNDWIHHLHFKDSLI